MAVERAAGIRSGADDTADRMPWEEICTLRRASSLTHEGQVRRSFPIARTDAQTSVMKTTWPILSPRTP